MTLQDRTEQNKQCWKRINELALQIGAAATEIDELHQLITENMLKIAAIKFSKSDIN